MTGHFAFSVIYYFSKYEAKVFCSRILAPDLLLRMHFTENENMEKQKSYHKKCEFRNLAISSLNSRVQEKVEGAIRKTNTIITKPISFVKTNENSEFRSFPHEIPSRSHISKYDKDLQNYSSDDLSNVEYWNAYKELNIIMASEILKTKINNKDMIWVNDLHFLLVPYYIRERDPDANIGLYIHAAFPNS